MAERVKVIARAGVVAEQVKAKGRTSEELRQKIRDMTERAIMGLDLIAQKEHLQADDIDRLGKLNRLLADLDRKLPVDQASLDDEALERIKAGKD